MFNKFMLLVERERAELDAYERARSMQFVQIRNQEKNVKKIISNEIEFQRDFVVVSATAERKKRKVLWRFRQQIKYRIAANACTLSYRRVIERGSEHTLE